MKITNVTAHHLPGTRYAWVFLQIDTDEGIRGLGQVSSGPHSAMVAAAASRLGPLLIGEDPSRIEYIWHKLYAGFNSLGSHGFVSALMSGWATSCARTTSGRPLHSDVPVTQEVGFAADSQPWRFQTHLIPLGPRSKWPFRSWCSIRRKTTVQA